MVRSTIVAAFALMAGCLSCGGAGINVPDASAQTQDIRVRARDPFRTPEHPEKLTAPTYVSAIPVAKGYFIASAEPLGPMVEDFTMDPAVVLVTDHVQVAGRLVDYWPVSRFRKMVIIRADLDARPIDLNLMPGVREELETYFASWGSCIKDKPRF